MFYFLIMCLFVGVVGVSANSLSPDMHGQDPAVITLHHPIAPLFNFIGFYRCVLSIRPLMV